MKGKCKYCGEVLPDVANIRCDNCDRAWQEGREHGIASIKEDIGRALRFLKSLI